MGNFAFSAHTCPSCRPWFCWLSEDLIELWAGLASSRSQLQQAYQPMAQQERWGAFHWHLPAMYLIQMVFLVSWSSLFLVLAVSREHTDAGHASLFQTQSQRGFLSAQLEMWHLIQDWKQCRKFWKGVKIRGKRHLRLFCGVCPWETRACGSCSLKGNSLKHRRLIFPTFGWVVWEQASTGGNVWLREERRGNKAGSSSSESYLHKDTWLVQN